MKPDEVVLKFLTSIGRPQEAAQYLSLFRATRPESFAVIALSDSVVRGALGAVVTDLRFLARLDLHPVVVVGLTGDGAARAETVRAQLTPVLDCQVVAPADAGATARAGSTAIVAITDADIDQRFAALTELAGELTSRKLVFLGRRSGLTPNGRRSPSLVDVTSEYDDLVGLLPGKQAALLARARDLLVSVPHRMTVAVTSPLDLLRELFTERGAGTLLRLGVPVERATGYDQIDGTRLVGLIEDAFGRPLATDVTARPVDAIYLAGDYRGVAVIEPSDLGGYLSKFAVGLAARGEGVGRDLWRAVARDYPRLYWRARRDNPVTDWYGQQADGLARGEQWTVFWRGLAVDEIATAIARARAAPVDL